MKIKYKHIKVDDYYEVPKRGAYKVSYSDGITAWYVDHKLHRTNGHAIKWSDGSKEWWVNDKQCKQKDLKDIRGK